jgi:hypothetical protein
MTSEKVARSLADTRELCHCVYEHLPKVCSMIRGFPVMSADSLKDIYRIGGHYGQPLDEVLEELVPLCGSSRPTQEELTRADEGITPLITVRDLVKYINRILEVQRATRS